MQNELHAKLKKLFHRNGKTRDFKYEVQFKEKFEVFQQKGRKVPIHLQEAVKTEIKKLKNRDTLKRYKGSAVIAKNSDSTVKRAVYWKELNKPIVKTKMQTPNLKDSKYRISLKNAKDTEKELRFSANDLIYAFG